MTRAIALSFAIYGSALIAAGLPPSHATACTANDFGEVVDQTAQALRDLNTSGAQRFQAKLKQFQQKYGLSDQETRARAAELQDEKMTDFNREIDTLVSQMDTLSQTPNDQINCEKLEELKRVRDRLLTVMGQKSGYMLAKADVELDRPATGRSVQTPQADAKPEKNDGGAPALGAADRPGKEDKLAAKPPEQKESGPRALEAKPEAAPKTVTPSEQAASETQNRAPILNPDLPEKRPNRTQTAKNWATENQAVAPRVEERKEAYADQAIGGRDQPYAGRAGSPEPPTSLAPPPDSDRLPPPSYGEQRFPRGENVDTTYSIEEISEAGRGIFGTVTAQFAAAINYSFQQFGRPNAYITGSEGGAAFLAGLRYGKGKFHSKTEPLRTIYWQGPSVGLDMGAEGSSALFLVYNLDDSEKLYGRFTGIGGSAYVAGGVGLNVLGKDGVIIAPIRTGLGLRLGANLAYLKFTERQTWNPF